MASDLFSLQAMAAPSKRAARQKPAKTELHQPLYVVTAFELLKALQSDDEGHGLLARRHAERTLAGVDDVQGCPDPDLFRAMRQLGLQWSERHDFAARKRFAGAVTILAREVMSAGRKPGQDALPGILRGIPAHDR
ncbi:MAG: hypothetical protein ACQRW7_11440 [Caulobacterales bacterium]|uniref:hypothetical protein n=1 Tax=Glycocaulis sp. TaxID=1969725 RepID=UPI003FA0B998